MRRTSFEPSGSVGDGGVGLAGGEDQLDDGVDGYGGAVDDQVVVGAVVGVGPVEAADVGGAGLVYPTTPRTHQRRESGGRSSWVADSASGALLVSVTSAASFRQSKPTLPVATPAFTMGLA